MEEEVSTLREELDSIDVEVSTLRKEVCEERNGIEILSILKERNEKLKKDIKILRKERYELKCEVETLKVRIMDLGVDKSNRDSTIACLKKENDDLRQQLQSQVKKTQKTEKLKKTQTKMRKLVERENAKLVRKLKSYSRSLSGNSSPLSWKRFYGIIDSENDQRRNQEHDDVERDLSYSKVHLHRSKMNKKPKRKKLSSGHSKRTYPINPNLSKIHEEFEEEAMIRRYPHTQGLKKSESMPSLHLYRFKNCTVSSKKKKKKQKRKQSSGNPEVTEDALGPNSSSYLTKSGKWKYH